MHTKQPKTYPSP